MKQSPYQLLMGVVLLGTVAFLSWQAGGLAAAGMQYIQSENGPGEQKQAVVVIDPGHGGTDPGKVGIDGQLEKDINLAVAKKLKTYLEASDGETLCVLLPFSMLSLCSLTSFLFC